MRKNAYSDLPFNVFKTLFYFPEFLIFIHGLLLLSFFKNFSSLNIKLLVSILIIPWILTETITDVPFCMFNIHFIFFLCSLAIYRETNSATSHKEFLKA